MEKKGIVLGVVALIGFITLPLFGDSLNNPISKTIFAVSTSIGSIGFLITVKAIPNTRERLSIIVPMVGILLYHLLKFIQEKF